MTIHQTYIEQAVHLALENVKKGKGGPFGCIIVKNDQIIAAEGNSVTTTNDPTAHAEVNAIRAACKKLGTFQLDDCIVYSSCEPCPMCLGAIYWARPKAVYFGATKADAAQAGFDDSLIYKELALPMNLRSIPQERIGGVDSNQPFREWLEIVEKIEY